MSPTVFRSKNIRFEIRPKERCHAGRPHVHTVAPDAEASIDLKTFKVLAANNFSGPALRRLQETVRERADFFMEKWNESHSET